MSYLGDLGSSGVDLFFNFDFILNSRSASFVWNPDLLAAIIFPKALVQSSYTYVIDRQKQRV